MQKKAKTTKAPRASLPTGAIKHPLHAPLPAIYVLRVWSVKKVSGEWHISQAARFDEKAQWSRPYETLQRATTAIARKMAQEVMERHKRHCEYYGIDD